MPISQIAVANCGIEPARFEYPLFAKAARENSTWHLEVVAAPARAVQELQELAMLRRCATAFSFVLALIGGPTAEPFSPTSTVAPAMKKGTLAAGKVPEVQSRGKVRRVTLSRTPISPGLTFPALRCPESGW
jgi:hypothetical protein